LKDLNISLSQLDHRKFTDAKAKLDQNIENYFSQAVVSIKKAVKSLYCEQAPSLQRLAATFRRGDLLVELARGERTK
jgi:hypothetical protein